MPFLNLAFPPIDREFNALTNYIDEFDRHFSRHHRFANCFIPRFDLEEDARFYYLYGDVPGVQAEDIIVEPRDDHTLVIYGDSHRSTELSGLDLKRVEKHSAEHEELDPTSPQVPTNGHAMEARGDNSDPSSRPASSPSHSHLPLRLSSFSHHRSGRAYGTHTEDTAQDMRDPDHKMLLNERLRGKFHRTFTLPIPMKEGAIQASMEHGVLSVLVPKREEHARKLVRRIPVVQQA